MQERETTSKEENAVKRWLTRIEEAEKHFRPDFERMREDVEFAAGYQWNGQDKMRTERYVANITLRMVNQKVASLYARNPKAIARVRDRMLYQVWDGSLLSLQDAVMRATANPLDIEANTIIRDYEQGVLIEQTLGKLAATLEKVYALQLERLEPEFKLQMKQLVRRVVTTGVGFARVSFVREYEETPTASLLQTSVKERTLRLQKLMTEYAEGEFDQDDPRTTEMQSLQESLQKPEYGKLSNEQLIIDFPASDTIIIDPRCKLLKGFVGARWIAQRYDLDLDEVNSFFGLGITANELDTKGDLERSAEQSTDADESYCKKVQLYEVFDKTTKSSCFVLRGFKGFVAPPTPLDPCLHRFWPIISIAFNDIEVCEDQKATLYPPSDVQLMKHAQLEWNRTRNSLKLHRTANRPKYISTVPLDPEDKQAIQYADEQAVIELKGLPAGTDASKVLVPIAHQPIDVTLYNTDPLQEDLLMCVGMQSENLGPTQPDSTATQATIAEQSRLSSASSNVDDLDDFLSDLAKVSGELLFREMSKETVVALVGPGAAWPESPVEKDQLASEVLLEIEAASSGRPNKALEIANFERMVPSLLQAGANPAFLVEEGIKRLDDRIDIKRAFPIGGPAAIPANGGQPLQSLPSQSPVPLAGHNQ